MTLYQRFRVFGLVLIFFGLREPELSYKGNALKTFVWAKLWALIIASLMLTSYIFGANGNIDLDFIADTDDLFVNLSIILINVIKDEEPCTRLYETVNKILQNLKLSDRCTTMIALKLNIWLSILGISLLIAMTIEFATKSFPDYVLLIKMPLFLSLLHLILHLYVIQALVKTLHQKLSVVFDTPKNKFSDISIEESIAWRYLINPEIKFIEINNTEYCDLKFLCKTYDDLSTCVKLLEKYHGIQVVFIIWSMFSSAIIDVALITRMQADPLWLVIARSLLPFLLCYVGCYIQNQTRCEVEYIELKILKYLIDFRCDDLRRSMLQTFKQLVSTNRLQFTACSLFTFSYSMILGAMMNVVTFSIILIQLFLNND